MKGKGNIRFCDSCSTNVVDMTKMTNDEIYKLLSTQKGRVCGHIKKSQVDSVLYQKQYNFKFAKSFLVSLLGLTSISNAENVDYSTVMRKTSKEISSPLPSKVEPYRFGVNHHAQKDSVVTYKGIVVDGSGDRLPGVNIILKGTTTGTVTDIDGQFILKVNVSKVESEYVTLNFSFIGWLVLGYEFGKQSKLDIEVKLLEHTEDFIEGMTFFRPKWYTPKGIWHRIKSVFGKH